MYKVISTSALLVAIQMSFANQSPPSLYPNLSYQPSSPSHQHLVAPTPQPQQQTRYSFDQPQNKVSFSATTTDQYGVEQPIQNTQFRAQNSLNNLNNAPQKQQHLPQEFQPQPQINYKATIN